MAASIIIRQNDHTHASDHSAFDNGGRDGGRDRQQPTSKQQQYHPAASSPVATRLVPGLSKHSFILILILHSSSYNKSNSNSRGVEPTVAASAAIPFHEYCDFLYRPLRRPAPTLRRIIVLRYTDQGLVPIPRSRCIAVAASVPQGTGTDIGPAKWVPDYYDDDVQTRIVCPSRLSVARVCRRLPITSRLCPVSSIAIGRYGPGG
jgi:hypothetical protein